MPRLIILDGNSLANRAFYALPMLTTADGRPTNVLHGFMMMLMRLKNEQQPDYWLVAFDKSKPTMRIEQYGQYKANRKETPNDLKPQFGFLKEVLTAFQVPIMELEGYEADDLIATVAETAQNQGWEVQIYTGDRDALQLISPRITVYLTRKGISEVERYDENALWERYQLRPPQIVDLKGLMGDSSDNIPGLPGVGEKTALKLLHAYGSVEEVLAHAEEVSGNKLRSTIMEHKDLAVLSKQLATMVRDVPIEFSLEELAVRQGESNAVAEVLEKYSLRNIARLLEANAGDWVKLGEDVSPSDNRQIKIGEAKELTEEELLQQITGWRQKKNTLTLCWHFEGSSPHFSFWSEFGIAANDELYILKREALSILGLTEWNALLQDEQVPKVVADAKTLYSLLSTEGVSLNGLELDLALAAYVINPARTKFEVLELVREYYPSQQPFANVAEEAHALSKVKGLFQEELARLGLNELVLKIEQPLSAILAQMEHRGIGLDREKLQSFGEELIEEIKGFETTIYELAGRQFNINSPKQLGEILFEELGLTPLRKTKTGYSTDADTLEELRSAHPIIEKILDYRQLNKLISTYVNGLLAQEREGKIHTTFQQTVTTTGRLSSTEPNLQNIPIRLEHGRLLRKVFRPVEPGWILLSVDYSQIELRILAHYSQDELLCQSFLLGEDVHTRTAAEVFGVPLEAVDSDMRRKAKAVNFGLVYGLTDFGLSRDLGIQRKEAKYYIDQYFARYHGVKNYLQSIVEKAKAEGEVRTLLNRLRRIPELKSSNRNQRLFGERIAMNTPIQGTAADIMKLAMINVAAKIKNHKANILLQVHDELLLEVEPNQLGVVAEIVKREMENAYSLTVPLTVDAKWGPNWYDMQPYSFKE